MVVCTLVLSCNSPVRNVSKGISPKGDSVAITDGREEELLNTVGIYLNDKNFYSDEWHDYMVFTFTVQNQSKKDIRAIRGKVTFTNAFDEELHSLELSCERMVPACGSVKQVIKMTFRPYMEKDVVLKERQLESLEIKWFPAHIIFMNNSSL